MLRFMFVDTMTLVVIAASVLGGAMAVPQALKLRRDRRTDGISPAWAGISAAVNAWWGIYGIGVGDWSIVPVSVVSVMAYLVIAVALVRFRANPWAGVLRPMLLTTVAVAAVPLAAVLVDGWATAGIVLGALYGVQLSPAVVSVYRASDVSGVAAETWLIAFVEAVLWGVYGFGRLDPGLLALATTGVVMSSLVLARLFVRRPRRLHREVGLTLAPA